ncbi:peptide ABC transporter ATP-binding protein [Spirochaetia bacterium]|nr:peptide ABC transporter ATP-binding protein [Spirochaetia bacterium]
MAETILDVKDLSVSFRMYNPQSLEQKNLRVINNLSVQVKEGEIVAVAGASGSGKSLLAHAILGILPANAAVTGNMTYYGKALTPELQKSLRGKELALVPQSITYLDPLMRVGKQVTGIYGGTEKQRSLFQRYGLGEDAEGLFPFQLSGGMARRILLATAVMGEARLIIADEPTPGMSADMARRAMGHFRELAEAGAGILLITHELDLAFEYADSIAVFYAGTTVEIAPASDFKLSADTLRHPYSKALWQALPQNGFVPVPGSQPYAGNPPIGCAYAPRCPRRTASCESEDPIPMREMRNGEVRCIHAV